MNTPNKNKGMKLVILILVFFITACNFTKKRVLIDYYSSGKVKSKKHYFLSNNGDTIIDRLNIYYYENGVVEDSFYQKNGLRQGLYYQFDSVGKLHVISNFKSGKQNGVSTIYSFDGKVSGENFFYNDSLIYFKTFHKNGKLKNYFIMKSNSESCYILTQDSSGKVVEDSGDSTKCKEDRFK